MSHIYNRETFLAHLLDELIALKRDCEETARLFAQAIDICDNVAFPNELKESDAEQDQSSGETEASK